MAYSFPKVTLPPLPKDKVSTGNKMIELKFCKGFDIKHIRIITLNSYEEFFKYFIENSEKGLIYDVKLI